MTPLHLALTIITLPFPMLSWLIYLSFDLGLIAIKTPPCAVSTLSFNEQNTFSFQLSGNHAEVSS
jgi:hypothetical protein